MFLWSLDNILLGSLWNWNEKSYLCYQKQSDSVWQMAPMELREVYYQHSPEHQTLTIFYSSRFWLGFDFSLITWFYSTPSDNITTSTKLDSCGSVWHLSHNQQLYSHLQNVASVSYLITIFIALPPTNTQLHYSDNIGLWLTWNEISQTHTGMN